MKIFVKCTTKIISKSIYPAVFNSFVIELIGEEIEVTWPINSNLYSFLLCEKSSGVKRSTRFIPSYHKKYNLPFGPPTSLFLFLPTIPRATIEQAAYSGPLCNNLRTYPEIHVIAATKTQLGNKTRQISISATVWNLFLYMRLFVKVPITARTEA